MVLSNQNSLFDKDAFKKSAQHSNATHFLVLKNVRFSQGLKVPLRGTFKPLRLNVRASRARLIIIVFDVLYSENW